MDAKLQNVQTNDMFEKMVLMLQSIVDEGSLCVMLKSFENDN